MRSPGRRAAPRHRAPSAAARARAAADGVLRAGDSGVPDGDGGEPDRRGPEKARPGGRLGGLRISPALRRLVVTPTFAAGLGVVVAAFLAANMSRTVLHFSAPFPSHCLAGSCHSPEPHGGTLASARPGVRITPRAPAAAGPVATPDPGSTGSATGGSGALRRGSGAQPFSVTYQQLEHWTGGFADQITISGLSGTRPHTWRLAFRYPGARIDGVQGARWEPGSTGEGVARGMVWPAWGRADGATAPVRLMVIVDGQPAPPSSCAFDGEPCTFASAP